MNPFRAAFQPSRKSSDYGGGVLGSLISEYIRGNGDAAVAYSEDIAMRVAAVSSCVRLISETIASLPLHVFVKEDDGATRVDPTNSLEQLLQKPNPYQTSIEYRELMTAHLLMKGNAYSYIDWRTAFVNGTVIHQAAALIPLNPDMVLVEWADAGPMPKQVKYSLKRAVGDPLVIPSDEILHLKGLSSDGLKGRSVIGDAKETLTGALSSQASANRMFSNDAAPGVILSHPKQLTPDQASRLRSDWDAAHQGAANARRTAVLEEGMTATKLSMTPDEAQFLETRKLQRSEIAGLFRVPPHLIGDVDGSTSWGTGIEQQQIGFLVYTIRPWLVRWEQAIARSLIIREDTLYVEHLVAGLLRADVASRYEAYVKAVNNAIFTPNEIRRLENVNPSDDPAADKLYRQASVVPIDTPIATGAAAGSPMA